MDAEAVIETLKGQYPREVRKQLVKAILESEKSGDKLSLEKQSHILNQIFSYVIKECQWNMPSNSKEWDNKPLEIMAETFPKLTTTKWYKDQSTIVSNAGVNLVMNDTEK